MPNNERHVFVYGARGHGKVVADVLRACGTRVDGFVDDKICDCYELSGCRILGNARWLAEQAARGPVALALGIGDNFCRRKIADLCTRINIQVLTAVHPSAIVSPSARISSGVVILPNAVVNADAEIGTGAIINTAAIVEHDCHVGSFVHLSPKATLGGGAHVDDLSWLGIGSVVLPGIKIGIESVVGAGATVIHDIGDRIVVVGTPARFLKEATRRS